MKKPLNGRDDLVELLAATNTMLCTGFGESIASHVIETLTHLGVPVEGLVDIINGKARIVANDSIAAP